MGPVNLLLSDLIHAMGSLTSKRSSFQPVEFLSSWSKWKKRSGHLPDPTPQSVSTPIVCTTEENNVDGMGHLVRKTRHLLDERLITHYRRV